MKEYIVKGICKKCGNPYFNILKHAPTSDRKFCDRCAHSRPQTKEANESRRNKLKGIIPWNKGKGILSIKKCKIYKCKNCGVKIAGHGKSGYCGKCVWECTNAKEKLSKALKGKTGGFKEGSVRNFKSGYYKDIRCDSSWELAYVLYNENLNNIIEKNKTGFDYIWKGITHKYYPDFLINKNKYIEIKGRIREQDQIKIDSFKEPLEVITQKEMKPILKFVISKYGKNFIKLYNMEC